MTTMPFTHLRIGDLYQPINSTFIFQEIIDYKGQLCFRSLQQQPPFWSIGTYNARDFKYIGNGVDDPMLRNHCVCLMNVNFWLMYGQVLSIPKTPEYYTAVKEWQRLAPTAQEMLIRKAYEKQKRWLTSQQEQDWAA